MKKGIVMEKHRRYTIVMADNGLFLKTKPVGDAADIGAEVSLELPKERKRHAYFFYPGQKIKHYFRVLTMACFLLLFALPIYLIAARKKTYAYIHVDMNPSVELEVNDQLHVLSIKPIDHNASLLADTLKKWRHKSLNETLSLMLDKSKELGFINDENKAIIGVSYTEQSNVSVPQSLKRYLNGKKHDWQVATLLVPKEVRKQAQEEKRSMNGVMAKRFAENRSVGVVNENETENMNYDKRAIIQSFYPIPQESAEQI